jgi:hypothetical protein
LGENTAKKRTRRGSIFYTNVFIGGKALFVLGGTSMPQIRCPNCGMTISLKNRKEIDLDLITNAVRSGPKSFTYLLHSTKLPRKTLSLRLREMCEGGMMMKNEGAYVLAGMPQSEARIGGCFRRLPTITTDKRIRAGILLALLLISSPVAAQVLASLFMAPQESPPPPVNEPTVIGSFTMTLAVQNVRDLYFWQVIINFNPDQMKVLKIDSGDFPEGEYKSLFNSTRNYEGTLMLGGAIIGSPTGWEGPGKLATITFGYFVNEYATPAIVPEHGSFVTVLLDHEAHDIPDPLSILTLTP